MNAAWLLAVRDMGQMVGMPSRSTAGPRPKGEPHRFKATITSKIRNQVKRLKRGGYNNREVAERVKISQSSVRRIMGQKL